MDGVSLDLGRRPGGRTLITASWVVGHKDGAHRLLRNGEVVFEGTSEALHADPGVLEQHLGV